ncbi:4a-hydroxytetrahydrobiopterin dehydratase [Candidatus Lariskella endosymbiont of Epinotia ramella]|uniref:4a-hydroxytetrahydrobiopterin dehydratase n=1 Tax=Candidatus Lariskella endosymbiont of Epinotia ramella TaxID=3066224 RepID=UPI0030D12829
MTNIHLLADKQCLPYQNDIMPLNKHEIHKLLDQLQNHWKVNSSGHVYKRYEFNNFIDAMEFANKVAIIAEREKHHPNLSIEWGACLIEIWTHKVNGLTESDFILAAKIEDITSCL